ncbi:Beta-glucosidase B [Paramyrothecium foliicola]|nr:Beta-glucosidase B [Paramyrothecium foliicola]
MDPQDLPALLSSLTLDEKISLLAGADFWTTTPIPSKGVPALKTSDGPNGARGAAFSGGTTAACFPAACSLASTFDVELARRIGIALGEETKTKGARCLLGPTICCHRHPLGGRNFESFSEDPLLAGRLATEYVKGLESTGVSATVKHFAVNEQETERLSVDAIVSPRALREIYLKPFEMVIKEAKPGAVMTSYNKINGSHADSHEFLLQKVLRGDWGWEGLVMSDWGGVNSVADSLNAGLDLEMPGPARWRRKERVLAALEAGELTEDTINERALRVLRFLHRQRCFASPEIPDEQAINKPEHRALIREAGSKGIVLLKNDSNLLPLTKEKVRGRRVALLGFAKEALAHGGGSASVNSHYKITPYEALTEAFKDDDVTFHFAEGADTRRQLPLLTDDVVGLDGKPGFTYNLYEANSSTLFKSTHGHPASQISLVDSIEVSGKSGELVGIFTPKETLDCYLTLTSLGPSKTTINGEVVAEQAQNSSDPMGFLLGAVATALVKYKFEAGKQYKINITSTPPISSDGEDFGLLDAKMGVRFGLQSEREYSADFLPEAIEAAKQSDYAIVFTGHTTAWESEGQDQQSFNLPKDGSQDRLVASVAAVNKNVIVVNSTGVAIAMPWLEKVQAVVQAWFPGQEAGNSIADVLTGARNPEGQLTTTFPKRLEDCAAYGNFPGETKNGQLTVKYEEGVFVGYRHFDRLPSDKVNFPFGFGLSYTTFDLSDLHVTPSENEWKVQVTVKNSGAKAGALAVQIYVARKDSSPEHPSKVLAAFQKVRLEAGASAKAEILVKAKDIATWSEGQQRWVVDGGEYVFSAAKNAHELVVSQPVQVNGATFAP